MRFKRNILAVAAVLLLTSAAAVPQASAKPSEYEKIVKHLKTSYRAKKVRVPFMWLARFAVKVVRPAGVKSFNVTLFQDLKFSRESLDREMQMALRDSFGPEWSPVFRVRSRDGQNAYMYIREAGRNIKMTIVTVEKSQAAVIRATFSPEKLADFIEDPSIFGISLGGSEIEKGKADDPAAEIDAGT